MVSEAAKFSVNASLPLVGHIRIDFEEDTWGHNTEGNEEPEAYTTALLTDSTNPSHVNIADIIKANIVNHWRNMSAQLQAFYRSERLILR